MLQALRPPLVLALVLVLSSCSEEAVAPETTTGESSQGTPSPGSPGPQGPSIAPREKVDGMWGIELWSAVRFPGEDAPPHRLQTLLAFPERSRWVLAPEENPAGKVRIVFQYGEHMYLVEPGGKESLELVGDGLRDQQRNMALRRALLAPAVFGWSEEEPRTADLGEAGRLEAYGPAARPDRLVTLTASGALSFHIEDIEWPEEQQVRDWPASWSLLHDGEVLWTESREHCEVLGGVHTRSFLPRDRREGERATPTPPTESRRGPSWTLLAPLPSNVNWDEAELVADLAVQSERASGREVQVPVTFSLRADGRVAQVRLVLPPDASPPAPWRQDGGSSILEMQWSGDELPPPATVREALETLRAEAARLGKTPEGAPYLHRLPGGGGMRLVLDVRG